MLFVLNHQILGDIFRSQQSLQDLHTLMLYDDGTRVQVLLETHPGKYWGSVNRPVGIMWGL